jgi:DNA-binding NtrC family response regulator
MNEEKGSPILVVSAKWQTRALLAAQIGETSERDVVSAVGVTEALGLIKLGGVDPALMLVDAGQRIAVEDVKRLMEAKRGTRVVLVVSRLRRDAFEALRDAAAATLVRPVSIGRIARTVDEFLGDAVE